MNDTTPQQSTEFVLRRLTDPVRLFGRELPPQVWVAVLAIVLAVGLFYVAWMYRRDSRGVGPLWASFLGLLRCAVYLLLAGVFLLPAYQSWEETTSTSRVVLLFDPSASMTTVDDIPAEGQSPAKLPTRQDKVLRFLADENVNFLGRLLAKNPVTAYRFARGLDDQYVLHTERESLSRAELEEDQKQRAESPAGYDRPTFRPWSAELWAAWLKLRGTAPEGGADNETRSRLEQLAQANERLLASGFFNGTDVGGSVLAAVNREISHMVQGVVVFSDGRSTEGADQAFRDLEQRAKSARIPIFVVAVGEERPQVRIEIADLRAPEQVQPEDRFRAVVEVTGEGLPDKEFAASLEVTCVRTTRDGKEEALDIVLVEAADKGAPSKKREEIVLGKAATLPPTAPPKFDRGTPPRAEVEFQLDAAALAKAAGQELPPGKKWEIAETGDAQLRFRARVPKDRLEVFAGKEHVSDAADLRVVKRPLRVLLFASAPTRDYQFVRTMLVRETEKKRAEVAIYLQPPPGRTERRVGVVQDVPPERLLPVFPTKLDAGSDNPDDKLLDLGEYDVILAFDPDWTQLSEEQLRLVGRWVDRGGGLVVVGGPINTLQLARPGANREKLKPVLDLYPVVLKDIRIEELDRTTTEPWPLVFDTATPEMEFLKLAEDDAAGEPPPFLADWQAFFGKGDKGTVERGFYNYYPVEQAKAGALVVARFGDPRARLKDNSLQPFLVLSDPASGRRVVWLGWGDTWRLRTFNESYYERFWLKLARYAGAGNQGRVNKRITPYLGRTFTANRFVEFEAKIDGRGGEPLPRTARPEVTLRLPAGVPEKEVPTKFVMKPKAGDDGRFTVKFQVRSPGEYGLDLKVPETGDTYSGKFLVKEANPELDDTRPDFDALYRLASPAGEVLARMADADRAALRQRLQRTRPGGEKSAAPGQPEEEPRLYFDLKSAELIPACMVTATKTQRNRGPIEDLWDGPVDFSVAGLRVYLPWLSWVLAAVVGLLSLEWLVRKLLRLA